MPFKDIKEGQTHFVGDGCNPAHEEMEEKVPHTAPMKKCERNIHCDYCPECWNKCPMCN
jgi:hypothetical protein